MEHFEGVEKRIYILLNKNIEHDFEYWKNVLYNTVNYLF